MSCATCPENSMLLSVVDFAAHESKNYVKKRRRKILRIKKRFFDNYNILPDYIGEYNNGMLKMYNDSKTYRNITRVRLHRFGCGFIPE